MILKMRRDGTTEPYDRHEKIVRKIRDRLPMMRPLPSGLETFRYSLAVGV